MDRYERLRSADSDGRGKDRWSYGGSVSYKDEVNAYRGFNMETQVDFRGASRCARWSVAGPLDSHVMSYSEKDVLGFMDEGLVLRKEGLDVRRGGHWRCPEGFRMGSAVHNDSSEKKSGGVVRGKTTTRVRKGFEAAEFGIRRNRVSSQIIQGKGYEEDILGTDGCTNGSGDEYLSRQKGGTTGMNARMVIEAADEALWRAGLVMAEGGLARVRKKDLYHVRTPEKNCLHGVLTPDCSSESREHRRRSATGSFAYHRGSVGRPRRSPMEFSATTGRSYETPRLSYRTPRGRPMESSVSPRGSCATSWRSPAIPLVASTHPIASPSGSSTSHLRTCAHPRESLASHLESSTGSSSHPWVSPSKSPAHPRTAFPGSCTSPRGYSAQRKGQRTHPCESPRRSYRSPSTLQFMRVDSRAELHVHTPKGAGYMARTHSPSYKNPREEYRAVSSCLHDPTNGYQEYFPTHVIAAQRDVMEVLKLLPMLLPLRCTTTGPYNSKLSLNCNASPKSNTSPKSDRIPNPRKKRNLSGFDEERTLESAKLYFTQVICTLSNPKCSKDTNDPTIETLPQEASDPTTLPLDKHPTFVHTDGARDDAKSVLWTSHDIDFEVESIINKLPLPLGGAACNCATSLKDSGGRRCLYALALECANLSVLFEHEAFLVLDQKILDVKFRWWNYLQNKWNHGRPVTNKSTNADWGSRHHIGVGRIGSCDIDVIGSSEVGDIGSSSLDELDCAWVSCLRAVTAEVLGVAPIGDEYGGVCTDARKSVWGWVWETCAVLGFTFETRFLGFYIFDAYTRHNNCPFIHSGVYKELALCCISAIMLAAAVTTHWHDIRKHCFLHTLLKHLQQPITTDDVLLIQTDMLKLLPPYVLHARTPVYFIYIFLGRIRDFQLIVEHLPCAYDVCESTPAPENVSTLTPTPQHWPPSTIVNKHMPQNATGSSSPTISGIGVDASHQSDGWRLISLYEYFQTTGLMFLLERILVEVCRQAAENCLLHTIPGSRLVMAAMLFIIEPYLNPNSSENPKSCANADPNSSISIDHITSGEAAAPALDVGCGCTDAIKEDRGELGTCKECGMAWKRCFCHFIFRCCYDSDVFFWCEMLRKPLLNITRSPLITPLLNVWLVGSKYWWDLQEMSRSQWNECISERSPHVQTSATHTSKSKYIPSYPSKPLTNSLLPAAKSALEAAAAVHDKWQRYSMYGHRVSSSAGVASARSSVGSCVENSVHGGGVRRATVGLFVEQNRDVSCSLNTKPSDVQHDITPNHRMQQYASQTTSNSKDPSCHPSTGTPYEHIKSYVSTQVQQGHQQYQMKQEQMHQQRDRYAEQGVCNGILGSVSVLSVVNCVESDVGIEKMTGGEANGGESCMKWTGRGAHAHQYWKDLRVREIDEMDIYQNSSRRGKEYQWLYKSGRVWDDRCTQTRMRSRSGSYYIGSRCMNTFDSDVHKNPTSAQNLDVHAHTHIQGSRTHMNDTRANIHANMMQNANMISDKSQNTTQPQTDTHAPSQPTYTPSPINRTNAHSIDSEATNQILPKMHTKHCTYPKSHIYPHIPTIHSDENSTCFNA